MKRVLLTISIFFFLFVGAKVFADYPQYVGYVNDFANVLQQNTKQQLEKKLSDYDKQTTNQVAVVTVKTIGEEPIEDYSIHLADQWKPGQKGKDNGVIMLFAMQEHRMRIEVGRGLEGDLTDIETKHIETDIIAPELKAGHYDAGITKGVDAVIAGIGSQIATASATTTGSSGDTVVFIILLVIVIVIVIIVVAASPYTPLGGSGSWGISSGWSSPDDDDDSGSGGSSGFGGFGGGSFSGGGSSSSW